MIRKFCLTLAVISAASFSIVSAQQTAKVTASGIGYLEYLPQGYNSNSDKYPVVISLHGIREKGANTKDRNRIIADLQKVDNVGLPKYVKQGQKYPFILISPQLQNKVGSWPSWYVIDVLKHVRKYLRIDYRRIYLTGLSLGGLGVWRTAGDYPDVFAAIGPICPGGNSISKADDLARENVAAWGFHGSSDKIVSYKVTTNMINAMNSSPKKPNPLAKATIFGGAGHVIWDKAYHQTNLLDWMLSHRKGSSGGWSDHDDDDDHGNGDNGDSDDNGNNDDDGGDNEDGGNGNDKEEEKPSKNSLPVVSAGPDRVITLPTNAIDIQAHASDKDGRITSYEWTQTYGLTRASTSGANSEKLRAYNLKKGSYIFRLRVKDNDGGTKDDYFKITVKKGSGRDDSNDDGSSGNDNSSGNGSGNSKANARPLADAGPDITVRDESTITLNGSGSDSDGRIVSYHWKQLAGPNITVREANSARPTLSDLKEGRYYFSLTVKDDKNATHKDKMAIRVRKR
jgi:dienelactone hydrolase